MFGSRILGPPAAWILRKYGGPRGSKGNKQTCDHIAFHRLTSTSFSSTDFGGLLSEDAEAPPTAVIDSRLAALIGDFFYLSLTLNDFRPAARCSGPVGPRPGAGLPGTSNRSCSGPEACWS